MARTVRFSVFFCFLLSLQILAQPIDSSWISRRQASVDSITHIEDYNRKIQRDTTWGISFNFDELDLDKINKDSLILQLIRINVANDSMIRIIRKWNIARRSDSLMDLYDIIKREASTSYNAWYVSVGQNFSDLSGLNRSLEYYGMPQLNEVSYSSCLIFNYNWKRHRRVNEIYMNIGFGQGSSLGDNNITYGFISPFNYKFGYSVINAKRIDVFPFVSLHYQRSNLNFNNNYQYSPPSSNTNVYDSLVKYSLLNGSGNKYSLSKNDLILDYGAEIDFHIIYSKRHRGLILGLRAAKTLPLLSSGWKLNKAKTSIPETNLRNIFFEVLLKIYWRRHSVKETFGYYGNDY